MIRSGLEPKDATFDVSAGDVLYIRGVANIEFVADGRKLKACVTHAEGIKVKIDRSGGGGADVLPLTPKEIVEETEPMRLPAA